MSTTLLQAVAKVKIVSRDDSGKLDNPDDYYDCLETALSAYSMLQAKQVTQDVACDANGEIAVSAITDFDENFLPQLKIEYPISTAGFASPVAPAVWGFGGLYRGFGQRSGYRYLAFTEYIIYQSPTGKKIRFVNIRSATVRILHRTIHKLPVDNSGATDPAGNLTVPDSDVVAVCWLAGAEALDRLAAFYANTTDQATGVEFVGFSTKSDQYERRAKKLREKFDEHLKNIGQNDYEQAAMVRG